MKTKLVIGVVVGLLVFAVYMFVITIFDKLESNIKASAQLEQSLNATNQAMAHQIKVTEDIIDITKDIEKQTIELSEVTRKNTYLISKGLKQNEKIDVDAAMYIDIINSMCLQWKAVSSATQYSNKSIPVPPNANTTNSSTFECSRWRNVTTRESYEYTIRLLEHIGKLNTRLQGLDKYGHSLVEKK